jgi:hypothetical protein
VVDRCVLREGKSLHEQLPTSYLPIFFIFYFFIFYFYFSFIFFESCQFRVHTAVVLQKSQQVQQLLTVRAVWFAEDGLLT